MAERLAPARSPIRTGEEVEVVGKSLSEIAEQEAESQLTGDEEVTKKASELFPVLAEEDDDWDDEETSEIGNDDSAMDSLLSQATRSSEIETAKEVPTKRGPPGGGKLVRERIGGDVIEASKSELTKKATAGILKPVNRPVLQPKSSDTATLSPVKTSILQPSKQNPATLKPVKSVLKPVSAASEEEE